MKIEGGDKFYEPISQESRGGEGRFTLKFFASHFFSFLYLRMYTSVFSRRCINLGNFRNYFGSLFEGVVYE